MLLNRWKCWGLIIILLSGLQLRGQSFGANPSSIRWWQIKTDSLQLIFPAGMDLVALEVAAVIQAEQRQPLNPLGNKLRRLPIVLQNRTTNSNGYVGLGPFRSEFFLSPPLNALELGAQDWAKNLALHEYRHGHQYNNFDRGLSHVVKLLFGDNGQGLASAMAVPDWFFEGDAVYNETMRSGQGRGRLPLFMNAFPILNKEGKRYSYQKIRNGSYVDYVPDHYQLGYLLVAYGYMQYGPSFWKKVTQDAASFKSLVFPFQNAIKRATGLNFATFREKAYAYYQDRWQLLQWDSLQYVTPTRKRDVVDYKYPYYDPKYGIIALRSGRRQVHQFVRIQNGHVIPIADAPISRDDYFGYNQGEIVFTRFHTHPRWSYKEYSDLSIMDIQTKKVQRLTHQKRYFTPDIAHHKDLLVASELSITGQSTLVLLNTAGEILDTLKAPASHLYTYPKFLTGDQSVVLLDRNGKGQMGIRQIGLKMIGLDSGVASGTVAHFDRTNSRVRLPMSNRLLGYPVVNGSYLYFTSTHQKIDETWRLYLPGSTSDSSHLQRLNHWVRGGYQSAPTDSGLVSSVFSSDGYRLVASVPKPENLSVTQVLDDSLNLIYVPDSLAKHSNQHLMDLPLPTELKIKQYPKFSHPFNFHSLQPNVDDPVYALSLQGQNILNTVQTELSYQYNRVDQTQQVGGNIVVGAWYLQPFIRMNYTMDRWGRDKEQKLHYYNELSTQFGLQLPLNFSNGKFYRHLILSSSIHNNWLNWRDARGPSVPDQIHYLYSVGQFSWLSQQTMQQIYPRLGVVIYGEQSQDLNNQSDHQWMGKLNLYLPGILPTHSLRLHTAYQSRKTTGWYNFSNHFPFSRGYTRLNYPTMWYWGADYDLPLIYPDFGLANLVYFSRVRTNLYLDQSYGKLAQKTLDFPSVGASLWLDISLDNQYPITIGLRYNHLLKDYPGQQSNNWELILPVHLF